MERTTTLIRAKEIMGVNFIGTEELKSIEKEMGIFVPDEILEQPPKINFVEELLENHKNDYLLILGIPYYKDRTPLTIVKMREHFGWEPDKSEPCFYNQDWYINEEFANKTSLEFKWYLLKKNVYEEHRGKTINDFDNLQLPSAVLVTYLFFSFLFHSKSEILWENTFIWCSDQDIHGDQIYVGRYKDPLRINKNGFNIHRYLKVRSNFSLIDVKNLNDII